MRRAAIAVALLAGAPACSSSYVTSGAAGADASVSDGEDDAAPSTGGEGGAGRDAAGEAAACVTVPVGAVPEHGGAACSSDASACSPGDVTAFTPRWVPPNQAHAGACTSQQIAGAYQACLGNGFTTSGCNSWILANESCATCISSQSSAASYGPLVGLGSTSVVNWPGCVALAEPCNVGCAQAMLAQDSCAWAACNPTSGPCASAGSSAIIACESAAETSCGCSAYTAGPACYEELLASPALHPAVSLCALTASDFETIYTAVATLMCGP